MKLGKYILGLAVVAAGLTSCDTDNVGAIYDHPAMPNISLRLIKRPRTMLSPFP